MPQPDGGASSVGQSKRFATLCASTRDAILWSQPPIGNDSTKNQHTVQKHFRDEQNRWAAGTDTGDTDTAVYRPIPPYGPVWGGELSVGTLELSDRLAGLPPLNPTG